jgi:enamine deaminase RidA (YjgF/YER057c/UK114 family)
MKVLQPEGWPRPKGYSNGMSAKGEIVFVAGQIGWNEKGEFDKSFAGQFRQVLLNTIAVLKEAGAGPEHITRMTWFITDKRAYQESVRDIGKAYRELIGAHYPTMTVVEVKSLLEDAALIEIESTAVIP